MRGLMAAFVTYIHFPFVQYALIAGVLISLCSSLLGVTLVLKRYSFLGDSLSHVAFCAMAIAAILQFSQDMPVVLILTVICAVLLLRTGQGTKLSGDASLAMISTGSLALGYLLMNVFSTSANLSGDVCSTLFGSTSILTLSRFDVWLCAVLAVVVIAVYVCLYRSIFAVTFDEDFARASGYNAEMVNLLLAVVIAIVIVLAMNLVGSLLISALIIFPTVSAMRVWNSFRGVMIGTCVLSVAGAVAGMLTAILSGTPVGASIVAVDILVFTALSFLGKVRKTGGNVRI